MKTSKLLTMLALPLAFVACTNDEFVADNGSWATGEVLSIGKDFALTVARGGDDADTRAGYHIVTDEDGAKWLRFFWEPKFNANGDAVESSDQIGLGWLNVPAAQDGRIYTNYQFAHKAWPEHDKTSKFQCKKWTDAYSWVNGLTENAQLTVSGSAWGNGFGDYALDGGDADLHRGLFMTDNKSIMAGDYIVYFPYDSSIVKNGYVKATSKKEFPANNGVGAFTAGGNDDNGVKNYLKGLADETFYISSEPVTLEGGVAANEFKMQAVSGIIRVKLNLANGTDDENFKGVNKIALYSKDGFIKEVELDAKKIGTANGAGLYVKGTEKKVNTLVATYASADLTTDVLNFCIPALPTTAKNVQVIIYTKDTNNKEYSTVVSTNQDLTVAPGRISNLAVTLTAANTPVAQFPVVDEASLNNAITNATDGATITLLDEIRLTSTLDKLDGTKALTLNGGNIIIPAAETGSAIELKLGKANNSGNTAKRVTVNNNIIIEEKGCCNAKPGLLTALNNVTLGGTVSNKGQVVFGDGTNAVKGIELKGVINNETTEFLDEEVAETYATITVKEKTEATIMNAMNIGENTKLLVDAQNAGTTSGDDGTLFIAGNKSLTNEGDILVKGNITNNNGDFVNNSIVTETVGAQITGSQITDQATDAEYICEVNSVARFGDAVDNDSHGYVTKVRFKNGEKTYVLDKEYKNILGAWIDFETDVNSDKSIEFKNKVISSSVVAAHTGDMTIKNGGFVISHNALTVESLTINQETSTNQGTFISGENLNVTNDVVVKNFWRSVGNLKIQNGITVGGNMVVENTNGKSVEFAKSKKANIAGNMTVSKDGAITFLAMSITNIKGSNGFANDGKVTIVTTTAGTEFPARVYSRSYTNGGDKTKWINGSEPIIKDSWNN